MREDPAPTSDKAPSGQCAFCHFRQRVSEGIHWFRGEQFCDSCHRAWVSVVEKSSQKTLLVQGNLRKLKRASGYKSRDLAYWLGIGEVMFSRYMSDTAPSFPSLERFVTLCSLMGVTPNEVLGFTDPKLEKVTAERDRYLADIGKAMSIFDYGWNKADAIDDFFFTRQPKRIGSADGLTPEQAEALRRSNNAE